VAINRKELYACQAFARHCKQLFVEKEGKKKLSTG
jgi:hypothetical protein